MAQDGWCPADPRSSFASHFVGHINKQTGEAGRLDMLATAIVHVLFKAPLQSSWASDMEDECRAEM